MSFYRPQFTLFLLCFSIGVSTTVLGIILSSIFANTQDLPLYAMKKHNDLSIAGTGLLIAGAGLLLEAGAHYFYRRRKGNRSKEIHSPKNIKG